MKKIILAFLMVWLSIGLITFNKDEMVTGLAERVSVLEYNMTQIPEKPNICADNVTFCGSVLNNDLYNITYLALKSDIVNYTLPNDAVFNNVNVTYDIYAGGIVSAWYLLGNGTYITDLPNNTITIENNITNNITSYVLNSDYVNASNAYVFSNLNVSKNISSDATILANKITIGTSHNNLGTLSSITGGTQNTIGNALTYNVISGGRQNRIGDSIGGISESGILSGRNNQIDDNGGYDSIISGYTNSMQQNSYSTILNGDTNRVRQGSHQTQLGGSGNWLGYGSATYNLQFGKNIVQQYDDYTMMIGRDMWFNYDDDYYALGANISQNNTARQFVVGFDDIDFRVNDTGVYANMYYGNGSQLTNLPIPSINTDDFVNKSNAIIISDLNITGDIIQNGITESGLSNGFAFGTNTNVLNSNYVGIISEGASIYNFTNYGIAVASQSNMDTVDDFFMIGDTNTMKNGYMLGTLGSTNVIDCTNYYCFSNVIFGDYNNILDTTYNYVFGIENDVGYVNNNNQASENLIVGDYNYMSKGYKNILLGNDLYLDGVNAQGNILHGSLNNLTDSQYTYLGGSGNIVDGVERSIINLQDSTINGMGNLISAGQYHNLNDGYADIVTGQSNYLNGYNTMIMTGDNNNVQNGDYGLVIGQHNNLGYNWGGSNYVLGSYSDMDSTDIGYIFGYNNVLNNSYLSEIHGEDNILDNSNNVILFGSNLNINGETDQLIYGNTNEYLRVNSTGVYNGADYYSAGNKGITQTISILRNDSVSCDLVITGGIITGTTC